MQTTSCIGPGLLPLPRAALLVVWSAAALILAACGAAQPAAMAPTPTAVALINTPTPLSPQKEPAAQPSDTATPIPTDTATPIPTDTATPIPTATGLPTQAAPPATDVPDATDTPVAADTPPPAAAAAAAPVELPPLLVESAPAPGTAWNGEPVTLTFDQPLAEASGEALRISPPLAGSTRVEGNQLIFTPAEQPSTGQRYHVTVDTSAASAAGLPLSAPVEVTLTTLTPLVVTSTQPSDGSSEVSTDGQITVIFNRPVVPLTGRSEQADLPQPLTIDPPLPGSGSWVNTSIYTYRPEAGLAGATHYTVRVDQIRGLEGESLAEPHTFSFTTAAPIVLGIVPEGPQARPDSTVIISFSQRMDPSSRDAVSVIQTGATPATVAGTFSWNDSGSVLTFQPDSMLTFGATYRVSVSTEAQPASRQGALRERFQADFAVVPLPAVSRSQPGNDSHNASVSDGVSIFFTAPMSRSLVVDNVTISPAITATQVYSWYSDYDNRLFLSWNLTPQTRYTVTLGAAAGDEYGNTLGKEYQLRFTTGDYAPFAEWNIDRFTHFSAYTVTHVVASFRNVSSLSAELYRLPTGELYKLTGRNQWEIWDSYRVPNRDANLIWSRTLQTDAPRNKVGRSVLQIAGAEGEPLPPGLYLIDLRVPELERQPGSSTKAVIVLTHRNMVLKKTINGPSLAWVTDLASGEPVADAQVRFLQEGKELASATTDGHGIAMAPLAISPNEPWWEVLAVSGEPGSADFALVSSAWNQGIGPWEFGIGQGYATERFRSAIYTDRPIYRPGQTVYWKGIIRAVDGDSYRLPPVDLAIHVTIRDERGNVLQEGDYAVNSHGTLHGALELAPEASTGYYFVEIRMGDPEQPTYAGAGFQVAEYRKPEFEITVTPQEPEVTQGDTVRLTVSGRYFSGGPLANAAVRWVLLGEGYTFNWADAPQGRYYSFATYDPAQERFDPFGGYYGGLLQEGTGRTDREGNLVIELPTDLGESLQSQRWTLDATVQSPTNQFVSGRASVVVHRGEYYIGLSPRSYVSQTGEPSLVDLIAITPQGEPYPPTRLETTVFEFRWNSVYERSANGSYRWETSVERTPVFTGTLDTDAAGSALLEWTPAQGGQYQIVAQGRDEAGNPISSAVFVWVSESSPEAPVAWPQQNNDRIELVADSKLYRPGDTAQILVPSPFIGPVYALVSVERTGIMEHRVLLLEGNSETIEVPISEEHIPNVYVNVILIKGIDDSNSIPAMRVGYVQLPVDVARKQLTIDVEPSASQVRPGETVAYTLTVRTVDGAPAPNAEVSVALIDKAVLSLAFGDSASLLNIFYAQQPLGVETGALLVINRDRLSQQVAEGAKGGGGGGDGGGLEIRQDFPDVAYWRADLTTDAAGQIVFAVTLPDNLTTWRLVARAITDETLVGEAVNDVVASKELQLRTALPRFFTAGDKVRIGVLIENNSQSDLNGAQLSVTLEGATFLGATDPTHFAAELDLAAAQQVERHWLIDVAADAPAVRITYILDGGELRDAVRLVLPVARYQTPEVIGTSGTVPVSGRLEAIRLPSAATDSGDLTVTLEPSLAAGMVEGLDYLKHYPYECNEQTVSRFLPNLLTMRALRTLGIQDSRLEVDLAFQLGVGLQRLVGRQNGDGGWGYWRGEESRPFISAYVLWGLWHASQMDYTVAQAVLNNGVRYLEQQFQAPKDLANRWQLNEMAFVHFVLAEMGHGDPGRMSTLYEARERLDIYGKALLAMALAAEAATSNSDDSRVQTLLDDIGGVAQVTATGAFWQEQQIDWWTLNTDTRTTSMVLAALSRLQPDHPLLPNVVRWLMQARSAGRWATTQETAWSLIGLTDWMVASGELEADYSWSVSLNGAELGSGTVNRQNLDQTIPLQVAVRDLLRDEANALRLERSHESGELYYTSHLRYYLDATAVAAADRGIVVARSFAAADGPRSGQSVSTAQVGDVISVTVTVVAPTDLYHLLVEVPIPAGTEPIDASLATTSERFGQPEFGPAGDFGGQGSYPHWRFWIPTHTDLRDEKVAFFATFLDAGTYEYTFQVRASTPGEFRVLPVYAEQMYFPEVWGRSSGELFTVTE